MNIIQTVDAVFSTPLSHNIICTIIAKNYIAFARTLCNSFLEHHPDGMCFVLIIDEFDGYLDPEKENFTLVKLSDLNIKNQVEFCFKYDITELSTAVKPYLLKYLFDTYKMGKLLYLDPDILITAPLTDLFDQLDAHDILLTPHLDKDFPDDGRTPNDSHVMISGIFNLGFIGVRRCSNVDRFFVWWQVKLYNKCLIDHAAGYFVDQKFIDLAFTLFDNIFILRDTGYNVAYWNLHSRTVRYSEERWSCNEGTLYFFHFSNYKPEQPENMSGHQTRHNLADLPDLKILFSHYRSLLFKNGYEEAKSWPYSYNKFNNRKEAVLIIKRLWRHYGKLITIANAFKVKLYPQYWRTIKNLVRIMFLGTAHWIWSKARSHKQKGR